MKLGVKEYEQKRILNKTGGMPVTFDDDSPELSEKQPMEFRRIFDGNRSEKVY
ncbi:MAG: hypothetical protein IJI66_00980 [Erysipelotrichaceae bacterium]|nr:hypothetical protein [Erysipelotrichaceae bacterium]